MLGAANWSSHHNSRDSAVDANWFSSPDVATLFCITDENEVDRMGQMYSIDVVTAKILRPGLKACGQSIN